jgi:hypothetical protein
MNSPLCVSVTRCGLMPQDWHHHLAYRRFCPVAGSRLTEISGSSSYRVIQQCRCSAWSVTWAPATGGNKFSPMMRITCRQAGGCCALLATGSVRRMASLRPGDEPKMPSPPKSPQSGRQHDGS